MSGSTTVNSDPRSIRTCGCGRLFSSRTGFEKHVSSCLGKAPESNRGLFKCPICGQLFNVERAAQRHAASCGQGMAERVVVDTPINMRLLTRARAALDKLKARRVPDVAIARATGIIQLRLSDIRDENEAVELSEVEALEQMAGGAK